MNPAHPTLLLNRWLKLLQNTQTTEQQRQTLLETLLKKYSAKGRVYHNANHLCEIFILLNEFAALLTEPDATDWAVFYHDAIYNPLRKDNEQRSAQLALQVMQQLNLPHQTIMLTQELILATQNHIATRQNVTLYLFLDADLAILGAAPEKYDLYARAIRTEYRLVPDVLYRPGRKRVLQHLLDKPALYYMPQMQARFEQQARMNIQRELQTL